MTTYLNGLKVPLKNIGGRIFRLNNLKQATKVNDMEQADDYKKDVREFKLLNLRRMESVYSDEESSDESNENSFDDEFQEDKFSEEDLLDVDSFMLLIEEDSGKAFQAKMGKQKPNFIWTHFIALPYYINKEFVEKYKFFKNTILNENFANVSELLFQKENRLHMTICLLQLKNKDQQILAEKIIKECETEINEITENFPITLDFDQFELMGTPNKTKVVYTRPDPKHESTEKIKDIIDVIIRKFVENELITQEMLKFSHISFNELTERYENQKLHLTLMNTTFLIRQMNKSSNEVNIKPYFNGQSILKKMKHFNFGATPTSMFKMYEMRTDQNGNYKEINSFTFKI